MKRIMSLMLGLSLLTGLAVFAQDPPKDTTKKASKSKSTKAPSKGKKKKATTTSTAPAPPK